MKCGFNKAITVDHVILFSLKINKLKLVMT